MLIISDGWDCGDTQLLSQEMARLYRCCYRVIWLNSLIRLPDYEPIMLGIKTVLPHIDNFYQPTTWPVLKIWPSD
jgi:uncharacterized protein with von Willebrand factor type A (vWA) domain